MVKSVDKCPAYRTISAACDGSEKSMDKLLKFYDAYISKASLRPLYDAYGNVYIALAVECWCGKREIPIFAICREGG